MIARNRRALSTAGVLVTVRPIASFEERIVEAAEPHIRDIDQVIAAVQQQIPDVTVWQWQKHHAADDDGIWWFGFPEISSDVQVENSAGMCPFLIETDEHSSHQARTAHTIAQTVQMIVAYLAPLR